MFGSGDVVALINKENHEKKAHYVVKSVIKSNDDQNGEPYSKIMRLI